MAMPQCCYLAKGAKRPSHTTNTIKFDRIPFDPCNSIKRFDLCPFDQINSTYLQPPAKTQEQINSDFEAISNWVDTNGMSLAPDKCYKLEFRGTNCQYEVGNISFEDTEVKDLGIFVKKRSQLVSTC